MSADRAAGGSTGVRLAAALGLLVAGALTGIASIIVHPRDATLVLAAAATIAALVALPPAWWARIPFALGWALPVTAGAIPRREGDLLVAATRNGWLLLGLALLLLVAAALSVATRSRRPVDVARSASGGEGT